MEKLLYFDYCAFVIISVLIFTTIYRHMTKGRLNVVFMELMVVSLISVFADIGSVWLDGADISYIVGKQIFHISYLVLHNLTTTLFILYMLVLTDTDHKLKKMHKIIFSFPFALIAILLLTNPMHSLMFSFSATGMYERGPLFFLLYLNALFYIICGLSHLLHYKDLYGRDRFFALFAVYPMMIIAAIIQMIFPHMLYEMLANSLSLLIISNMIQKPEEYIDTDTQHGKRSAYVANMRRALANGKNKTIVMLNFANYQALHDMLGYLGIQEFLSVVAKMIVDINKKHGGKAERYYLGDGKFRLVLDVKDEDLADEIARDLQSLFNEEVKIRGLQISFVTVVCIAHCPKDIEDVESLMQFGDDLNTHKFANEILYAKDVYRAQHYNVMRDIDQIIEKAIAEKKFEVYYQPIYSVKDQRFRSAEALIRLKDEQYGYISPDILIPAAERSGAIHRMGDIVLSEVCKFISSEVYKELELEYIEINLSVAQCMRVDLADDILDKIKRHHVEVNQINLEITETAASYSQNTMMDNIRKLTKAGIPFSLDDYGTGYSNMKRIASMPFEIVKLDKSIIHSDGSEKMQVVLENTVRMIKEMGMKIVVEGVDSEELVKQYSDLECEYIQGYYFSKPLSRNDFIEFVLNNM